MLNICLERRRKEENLEYYIIVLDEYPIYNLQASNHSWSCGSYCHTDRFQSNLDFGFCLRKFNIMHLMPIIFTQSDSHTVSSFPLSWLEMKRISSKTRINSGTQIEIGRSRNVLWFYFNLQTSFRPVAVSSLNIFRIIRYLHIIPPFHYRICHIIIRNVICIYIRQITE